MIQIYPYYLNLLPRIKITRLDLSFIDFSEMLPEQVEKLFDFISKSNISSLDISHCHLDKLKPDLGLKIFDLISKSNIKELNIEKNGFRK